MDGEAAPDKLLDPLTGQEMAVLKLLAEDLSNQEIGERLFLSASTVKWYVRQLNSKLDTTNREEIVQRAYALGLLRASDAGYLGQNLPRQTTPFVGRQTELGALRHLLAQGDARLITILAPGGMGKTRVAVQAALDAVDLFPDGIRFVDLALHSQDELTTATMRAVTQTGESHLAEYASSMIVDAVADALGYQYLPGGRSQKQQVLDLLEDKRMLLVLDSFEHLLDGAPVLSDILQRAAAVTLLVTSRERLNLLNETVYPLSGLSVPDRTWHDSVLESDSVQLFLQTARRLKPTFEITGENAQAIAHICQLTEGMPLGLLLATSWMDTLTLDEIILEINRSLDFLAAELRDLPARQRSIRAVFEAAWRRLNTTERDAFVQLSVFRGSFTREAASAVAKVSLAVVKRLVNKALITQTASGRYRIHELLRQYAASRLVDSPLYPMVVQAHTSYFAELAARYGREVFYGDSVGATQRLDEELPNIRAVWMQAISLGDANALSQLSTLWLYYDARGLWQEMMEVCATALNGVAGLSSSVSGELLTVLGICAYRTEAFTDAEAYTTQAIAIFETMEMPQKTILPRLNLANIWVNTRRLEEALDVYTALAVEAREAGLLWEETNCYANWAYALLFANRLDEAEEILNVALEHARTAQDLQGIMISLHNLGDMAYRRGDLQRANLLLRESLSISAELDNVLATYLNLVNLGRVALLTDDYSTAHGYLVRATEIDRRSGLRQLEHFSLLALVGLHEGRLEEARRLLVDLLLALWDKGEFDYLPVLLEALPFYLHRAGFVENAALWLGRFLASAVPEPVVFERLTRLAQEIGSMMPTQTIQSDYASTLQLLKHGHS